MSTICENYSGIVINQNRTPTKETDFLAVGASQFYQSFRLPGNYQLGTDADEFRYPDLSGFQLLVDIDEGFAANVSMNYTLDYYIFGSGWANLTKGTIAGSHADGPQVWLDVIFPTSVPVSQTIANSLLRIGFQNTGLAGEGIESAWFSEPNPLASGQALSSIATPLKNPEGDPFSFCFRILSLTADSGIDFLGNPYRSVVVQADANNTSSTNGSNSGYWLSAPQPSKFAVVSNYFDMRPVPSASYGFSNLIVNPNFEYDAVGEMPKGWSKDELGTVSFSNWKVEEGWSAGEGKKAMHVIASLAPEGRAGIMLSEVDEVPVIPGAIYHCQGTFKPVTLNGCEYRLENTWYTAAHVEINNGLISLTVLEETVIKKFSKAPPNAAFMRMRCYLHNPTGSTQTTNIWYDNVAFTPVKSESELSPYFDGDSINCQWTGQPGSSGSIQVFEEGPEENTVVIDSVLLDPLTPNIAFNVYYSSDGVSDETTTEQEWENKLWTRVPKTFVANQRQTYVFPEPIATKFVKIEYSHLQAQSYNAGQSQIPTTYKKFPKWVEDFFLAQLESPQFIASNVGVTYDALTFAYNPFLKDLAQDPDAPVTADSPNANESAANLVDATTLERIKLNMKPYQQPPAAQADPSTLLGKIAQTAALSSSNYSVESNPSSFVPIQTVSSLNRGNLVAEESMPIMFFYLTCRHAYKELSAPFDHNRAYFAGVKEVAFIRNNYTTTADENLYIENGADDLNVEVNDFVIEDQEWFTYVA